VEVDRDRTRKKTKPCRAYFCLAMIWSLILS
jgi:hypothetical protein